MFRTQGYQANFPIKSNVELLVDMWTMRLEEKKLLFIQMYVDVKDMLIVNYFIV